MFIAYGADILCGIDQPGNSDLFRFNGTAGERIKIETLGRAAPVWNSLALRQHVQI